MTRRTLFLVGGLVLALGTVADAGADAPWVGLRVREVVDRAANLTHVALIDDAGAIVEVDVAGAPAATSECGRHPLALRTLARLRDAVAAERGPRAAAAAVWLAERLGPYALTASQLVPSDLTLADGGATGCQQTVSYRYSTCSGDCGTVDGQTIACTCSITGPVRCPSNWPTIDPMKGQWENQP